MPFISSKARSAWDLTTAYEIYMASSSVIVERGKDRTFSDRQTSSPQPLGSKQQVVKERFWTYFGHTLVITIIPPATQ